MELRLSEDQAQIRRYFVLFYTPCLAAIMKQCQEFSGCCSRQCRRASHFERDTGSCLLFRVLLCTLAGGFIQVHELLHNVCTGHQSQ